MAIAITQERLKRAMSYDPLTGHFTRIEPCKRRRVGERAGTLSSSDGYIYITIDRKRIGAHRLAWLYMTGEMPKHEVDHKHGVRTDNRWSELREATRQFNAENIVRPRSDSVSGLQGVNLHRPGKYRAQIRIDGRMKHLGLFDSAESAHAAFVAAKRQLHAGCTI